MYERFERLSGNIFVTPNYKKICLYCRSKGEGKAEVILRGIMVIDVATAKIRAARAARSRSEPLERLRVCFYFFGLWLAGVAHRAPISGVLCHGRSAIATHNFFSQKYFACTKPL
jgi:hypothetical protein